jgi:tRNA-dihydrouridine synthase B
MSSSVESRETTTGARPAPLFIGNVVVDPPVLQAPMAGYTNFAFRQIVREFGGAGLLATEMISARGFDWLDRNEAELPDRLWGVSEEPRPLAVQIWDNDPEVMARVAARLAHDLEVSIVDINFGCPVRQVTERARSGSYLLKTPTRIGQIVERVVRACEPTPVTAKIRLGCSREQMTGIEVARVVESAGAAALTVHGRTASEFFRGNADWESIAEIRQHLRRIPLIGNGDLDNAAKVLDVFRNYDVDGVMIARAVLGRPWLFAQVAAALRDEPIPPDPSLEQQQQCLLRHFALLVDRFGDAKATMLMRTYACKYAQGKPGARAFRTHVARVDTPSEFLAVVREHFPRQ